MSRTREDITIINGDNRLLLIAPHGRSDRPKDDVNTDKITIAAAQRLRCSAVVNDGLSRRICDFNSFRSASARPDYLSHIKKVVDSKGHTLVVWIHGAGDRSIDQESRRADFNGGPDSLHAVIGYGQGPNPAVKPKDDQNGNTIGRFTANRKTVEKFCGLLTQKGMTTIPTSENAHNFCGRAHDNMNQWFIGQGYRFDRVESIQLEIRMTPFRLKEHVDRTAQMLADALAELVRISHGRA